MLDYPTGARALGQVARRSTIGTFRRPELTLAACTLSWAADPSLQKENANYSSWAIDARIDG